MWYKLLHSSFPTSTFSETTPTPNPRKNPVKPFASSLLSVFSTDSATWQPTRYHGFRAKRVNFQAFCFRSQFGSIQKKNMSLMGRLDSSYHFEDGEHEFLNDICQICTVTNMMKDLPTDHQRINQLTTIAKGIPTYFSSQTVSSKWILEYSLLNLSSITSPGRIYTLGASLSLNAIGKVQVVIRGSTKLFKTQQLIIRKKKKPSMEFHHLIFSKKKTPS